MAYRDSQWQFGYTRPFSHVVGGPERLQVGVMYCLFKLLWVTKIKRGQGANVIEMPSFRRSIVPGHAREKQRLYVCFEVLQGTA